MPQHYAVPMAIEWPQEKIEEFCRKWPIQKLEVFGSVTRDDFKPDSDIDLLYTFDVPSIDQYPSLFDVIEMEQELEQILGRRVDFVSRNAIEHSPNWIRKKLILESAVPVYES